MNSYYNFENMTLLMNYINERSDEYKMRFKFSLLSEYFESLPRTELTTKTGDFYPYGGKQNFNKR